MIDKLYNKWKIKTSKQVYTVKNFKTPIFIFSLNRIFIKPVEFKEKEELFIEE